MAPAKPLVKLFHFAVFKRLPLNGNRVADESDVKNVMRLHVTRRHRGPYNIGGRAKAEGRGQSH
jgi:hypothetical protein